MLKVSHLSHSFGTHWALKNVSFSLEKGEFLFLSGPSGAGKTTLLRLLHGALPVQRGAASVAGFDLTRLSGRTVPLLRRQVSVVFQDFKILPERSVYANVALPLEVRGLAPQHIGRRVRAVVRALGLENRLDTPGGELSGGEQQRVAVARSIVVNPQVLLADEPTGNLDPELSLRLMDIFMQFHAYGTTVVLATHSPELIRRHPDARLLRLDDGMITHANWPGGEVFRCADGGLHLGDGGGGDYGRGGMDPCGLDAPGIPGTSRNSGASGDDTGSDGPGNPDGRLSL
nr:cell division ATP-binding protein FtsE [Nitratidesulfovibrio termitidis]